MKGESLALPRRLLAATVLATGFGTLWLIAVAVLGTIVLQTLFSHGESPVRETIVVRSDGEPLIEARQAREIAGYRDLDRRPLAGPGQPLVLPVAVLWGSKIEDGIEYFFRSGRVDWNWRLRAFEDDQHQSNHWFFVHDGKENGAGYFVGYNWATLERIGFIGESGFSPDPLPPQQWIPVDRDLMIWAQWSSVQLEFDSGQVERRKFQIKSRMPSHLVYVPSGNRLQLVDVAQRTVRTVFEADSPIEAISLANESPSARPVPATAPPPPPQPRPDCRQSTCEPRGAFAPWPRTTARSGRCRSPTRSSSRAWRCFTRPPTARAP